MDQSIASVAGTQASLLDTQAARLLQRTRADSPSGPGAKTGQDAKIDKSAKDFESILMGNWLQQAENSFATVPGGDDEDDEDPGKGQFQGIAMQALAGSLTASGGIGIAKMIAEHLHRTADHASNGAEPAGSPVGVIRGKQAGT